ncbi:TRAP transporter small permease subunit [Halomonas sp. MCCC 1A11036]|uniref:TRAP transporter small permease protein n=2 Tax=Billgrantia zhangzhouensis TaxID=2733481 RepID=A0ABS9AFN2_9GAMM|nr:TRAP transporter small permease subunit [Halomonas zhangzhouensis]
MLDRLIRFCHRFEGFLSAFGKLAGWLIIPMLLTVAMTIGASLVGWNRFFAWEMDVFLLGDSVTVNTLLDLQWHIFLIIVMLGGAYALVEDSHVSVDLFYGLFSSRWKVLVTILGDVIFLIPFCAVMLWFSWGFTVSSYLSGEGSSYGGLLDRWFVKAFLPLGFTLILLAAMSRVIRLFCELFRESKY